jgi:catechol 2,3-dioxygenase
MKDWWRIYNLANEEEVSAQWDPEARPPRRDANYNETFTVRRVESAPLHPSNLTDACFATRQFGAMKDFYLNVAGLSLVGEEKGRATFAGAIGRHDITLLEAGAGEPVGLRSFSLLLAEPIDAEPTIRRLANKGVKAIRCNEVHPALRIQDPDGHNVDFYSR